MKLNKFLLGLLIVPALSLVSCSDYEDTEVTSPQADENVLGANFKAGSINIIVHPDKKEFELVLNRVNTKGTATVPVTVESCSELSEGVKFCNITSETLSFLFAAGESTATIPLSLNDNCKFQEVYELALTLGKAKDNPYASGTSSTRVSVSKDYIWKTLGQPVVVESGWYDGGILAEVQWASDYKKEGNDNKLFRIATLYTYAGTASKETGHLQFYLDGSYNPQGMFSTDGYDPESIDTGVQQNTSKEDKIYYHMNVKSLERTPDTSIYIFTYDVFYNSGSGVETFKSNVKATLDYDIKSEMKNKKLGEFAKQ